MICPRHWLGSYTTLGQRQLTRLITFATSNEKVDLFDDQAENTFFFSKRNQNWWLPVCTTTTKHDKKSPQSLFAAVMVYRCQSSLLSTRTKRGKLCAFTGDSFFGLNIDCGDSSQPLFLTMTGRCYRHYTYQKIVYQIVNTFTIKYAEFLVHSIFMTAMHGIRFNCVEQYGVRTISPGVRSQPRST